MGSYLIKPELDVDLYVWWSSISDSPVLWGSRKEFKKKYKKRKWMWRFGEDFKEQLARADSTHFGSRYRMGKEALRWGGYVGNGIAYVPIERLPALLKAYEEDLNMAMDDPRLRPFLDIEELDD